MNDEPFADGLFSLQSVCFFFALTTAQPDSSDVISLTVIAAQTCP
jgi:hypothetical protein